MAESALAVNVPEAEKYVAPMRDRFDPSARRGAPAHITLLYPFAQPAEIGRSTLRALAAIFSAAQSFAFHLAAFGRFADTLYLTPEPARAFADLTRRIVERFPRYPPYGGRFAAVVPHLTVARGSADELAIVERRLSETLPVTGIQAYCQEVVLIENSSGRWLSMHAFPLSPAHDVEG
jgi:2'-5' RNA ligase